MSRARDFADLAGAADAGGLTGRNLIINGAMQVAQRGDQTSVTTSQYGSSDRFKFAYEGTSSVWTLDNSTTAPSGFSNSSKLLCTTADTSQAGSSQIGFEQRIEAQNLQHLQYGTSDAKAVTLSFWVRSNKTGTYAVTMYAPDGGRIIGSTYSISSSDTWEHKSITFPGDTGGTINNDNGRGFDLKFLVSVGSTYRATDNTSWGAYADGKVGFGQTVDLADTLNNEWYITGVQLEVGEQATPFEHRSIHDEQLRCFRYYHDANFGSNDGAAYSPTTDQQYGYARSCIVQFPVEMRATPTVSIQSTSANSMDRYGRGQELCYPKAENIRPDLFQNILKYTSAAQTTLSNWQDAGRYINRAGYKADAEL